MPNRRRSTGPRAPPKLFKCTGYGNCNMVFTRSEHLLRHERKHTGEKPYKCIVPGCERMFSRFDNMMQHTQTHDKNRKSSSRRSSIVSTSSQQQKLIAKTNNLKLEDNQSIDEPIETTEKISIFQSRTLPPLRRNSISTYNPTVPPTFDFTRSTSTYFETPRNRFSWPIRKEPSYYMNNHEYEPFLGRRPSTASTISSESSTLVSPVSATFPQNDLARRRISIDDLRLPIEDFKHIQLEDKVDEMTVDITSDEFEALEGFSKFHSKPVTLNPDEELQSPKPLTDSPNLASQVCAMRQRVMTTNESYQRG